MGTEESHFNSALIARGKLTRRCPQSTTFQKEMNAEAGNQTDVVCLLDQPSAWPLGQVGNLVFYTQSVITVISQWAKQAHFHVRK